MLTVFSTARTDQFSVQQKDQFKNVKFYDRFCKDFAKGLCLVKQPHVFLLLCYS